MKKKEFNLEDWSTIDKTENPCQTSNTSKTQTYSHSELIATIKKLIELANKNKIDLTNGYENYRNIGFGLADALEEEGRKYFHEISKNHEKYNYDECNSQFDKCLKSKGSGITISTLFHYAKEAGINLDQTHSQIKIQFPKQFDSNIYEQIPDLLKPTCLIGEGNIEQDLILIGNLLVISAALPNISGYYDRSIVFPNLYAFIAAGAGNGKGIINKCRNAIRPIHLQRSKQPSTNSSNSYQKLLVPANSSATGMMQLMAENPKGVIIMETEGDSMSNTLKTEYGNYSDLLRKAFHHESISYYRKLDKEYQEIDKPRLSTLLTGTFGQLKTLMPSPENGLFSRFMYYTFSGSAKWRNVFSTRDSSHTDTAFNKLGEELLKLCDRLEKSEDIVFSFTENQEHRYNQFFEKQLQKWKTLAGESFAASVLRLGVTGFRIAMIFSSIRLNVAQNITSRIKCNDVDFETTLSLLNTLILHTKFIHNQLPGEKHTTIKFELLEVFYDKLPSIFSTTDYKEVAQKVGINVRTAERHITQFVKNKLIIRTNQGNYKKY